MRCLPEDLSRVLDMGAGAVQIPMVSTAEQARELAAQVRYPKVGRRGSAFSSRARTTVSSTSQPPSFPSVAEIR